MKTRKELQEEYKQRKFRIGVFQVRNTTNNKIFVGSSVNCDAMWNRIRLQLQTGSHPSTTLQSDWNALGDSAFVFEVISEVQQKEDYTGDYAADVKGLEEMFIEELQPFGDKGYNKQKLTTLS